MEKHNHEHDAEEMSAEELLQLNEDKVDALITLLIKKNVIKEDELQKAMDELYEEE